MKKLIKERTIRRKEKAMIEEKKERKKGQIKLGNYKRKQKK